MNISVTLSSNLHPEEEPSSSLLNRTCWVHSGYFHFQSNTNRMCCFLFYQILVFALRIAVTWCVCNTDQQFKRSKLQSKCESADWLHRVDKRCAKISGAVILSSMSADGKTRPSWSDPAGVMSGEPSGGASHRSLCLPLTCFNKITLQSDQRTAQVEAGWSCLIQTLSNPALLGRLPQAWGEEKKRGKKSVPVADANNISSCTSAEHRVVTSFHINVQWGPSRSPTACSHRRAAGVCLSSK